MSIVIAAGALLPMALVLGLLIGSFLNVVIHRVPEGLSIVSPPSHCPRCSTPIAPFDNVPLVSYAILRGRCRSCGASISLRYPAVELLTGLIFVAIAMRFGASVLTPVYWAFAAALIAAAMIDYDHQIIPDGISLGGLAVALVVVPLTLWHQGMAYRRVGAQRVGQWSARGVWSVAFLHARISVAMGRRFKLAAIALRAMEADCWLWFPGLGLGDVCCSR